MDWDRGSYSVHGIRGRYGTVREAGFEKNLWAAAAAAAVGEAGSLWTQRTDGSLSTRGEGVVLVGFVVRGRYSCIG